jgi:hypothetical protein
VKDVGEIFVDCGGDCPPCGADDVTLGGAAVVAPSLFLSVLALTLVALAFMLI